MDPMQCVIWIERAYSAGQIEEALELTRGYMYWKEQQGFRPKLTARQKYVLALLTKRVKNEAQS